MVTAALFTVHSVFKLLLHAHLILFCAVQKEKGSTSFHGFFMVIIKKAYIRFYFHHDNHGEEPAGFYGENTSYTIFSPYMVNMVYSENKRNLYTHRHAPKKSHSPGPKKIAELQVRYTNLFIILLYKILWVVRRVII